MILTKDKLSLGLVMGFVGPIVGLILFKLIKFGPFSWKEVFQFMMVEPGFRTLSVALSLSLLINAALFTLYINARKDYTAKGLFITTLIYGAVVLLIKFFN